MFISINSTGATADAYGKKELDTYLTAYVKVWKTRQFLEDNVGEYVHNLGGKESCVFFFKGHKKY